MSTLDTNTFSLWRVTASTFQFRTNSKVASDSPDLPPVMIGVLPNSPFIGLDDSGDGGLVATAATPGDTETFQIIRNPNDPNRVQIKAQKSGLFIRVKPDGSVAADYPSDTLWKEDDPSVFLLNVDEVMEGEFQLINGLGQEKASKILQDHWNSYIVEDDFKFMAENGINSVRIPVGYWIAYDNPPFPFLAGSLAALDNAFKWGKEHGVRIIVDLHAVPGAANAGSHGGSRDGALAFGLTDETIDESVRVISFLAQRYAHMENFLAIEVINEPVAPQIKADKLEQYYEAAYNAVREHSPSCYVIFSTRFFADETEFLDIASRLPRTALDVHNYQIIWPTFAGMTAQENIDYVRFVRPGQMEPVNPSNGRPLLYIGEWTGEWQVQGASKEEYQEFVKAQQDVYGMATFGWTYWTFKNPNNHWSMKWMIENGYLSMNLK